MSPATTTDKRNLEIKCIITDLVVKYSLKTYTNYAIAYGQQIQAIVKFIDTKLQNNGYTNSC